MIMPLREKKAASKQGRQPTPSRQVYQFKITLRDTTPVVWRRIQVPDRYSFWDLHCAITDCLGWLDYHLHLFTLPNPKTGETVHIGVRRSVLPANDPQLVLEMWRRSGAAAIRLELATGI
jgi:hypothetical protein